MITLLPDGSKWTHLPGDLENGTGMVEYKDGDKRWYLNYQLHRTDGPALINIHTDNRTEEGWYLNGKSHRIDGPSYTSHTGYKEWKVHGKLHRTDGPAIEGANGSKHWWVDGVEIDPPRHLKLVR
jgi:hypothetical protein